MLATLWKFLIAEEINKDFVVFLIIITSVFKNFGCYSIQHVANIKVSFLMNFKTLFECINAVFH